MCVNPESTCRLLHLAKGLAIADRTEFLFPFFRVVNHDDITPVIHSWFIEGVAVREPMIDPETNLEEEKYAHRDEVDNDKCPNQNLTTNRIAVGKSERKENKNK